MTPTHSCQLKVSNLFLTLLSYYMELMKEPDKVHYYYNTGQITHANRSCCRVEHCSIIKLMEIADTTFSYLGCTCEKIKTKFVYTLYHMVVSKTTLTCTAANNASIIILECFRATAMTSFSLHFHMANSNSIAHFVEPALRLLTS